MLSAALYIRVSTDDQLEFSPAAQKRALLKYAKDNQYIVTNENIFIDEGISGRIASKRPAFMKMIASAKAREKPFDVVLVHKFDRFARSREDSVVYKSLLLKECGIKVISITESIEDDKFSVILEAMLEAMAEYYSINLSEEVLKGMTEKARRGEYQTRAPIGYLNNEKSLIVDEASAQIVRMIFNSFLDSNMSIFAIAKRLNNLGYRTKRGNLYESRTVKYILQNPVYKGYTRWGTKIKDIYIVKGDYQPIIDEYTFDRVQAKISAAYRPSKTKPIETQSHWLIGVLKCSNCGASLVSNGNSGFQCSNYSKSKCNISHYISIKKMEATVLDVFLEFKSTNKIAYSHRQSKNDLLSLESTKMTLATLAEKEKRIQQAYLNGIDTIEEYKINRGNLNSERMKNNQELARIEEEIFNNDKSAMKHHINDIYDIISSPQSSKEEKSNALKAICEKIVFNKKTQNIDVYLIYT